MTSPREAVDRRSLPRRLTHHWLLAALLLAVALLIRLPTLAFPIVEAHPWRQTFTAFPAVIYAKEGIDLLNPQVPVFGPPWVVPMEFPLFQAAAALLIQAGVQMEVALRGLSLLCFLATAAVLWLMLRRHVNDRTALIALVVFLFSPFALLWSRTSMIEYPATLGVVVFMFGTLEWHAGNGRRWFLLALIGGSAAALIKITTAVFWVAPALLTRRAVSLVLCVIPGIVGLAWLAYGSVRRAEAPPVAELDNASVVEFYLLADRLDPIVWMGVVLPTLFWMGMLLLPFALLVVHRSERLVWAWFTIAMIGPWLVFTNHYAIHDYYAVAISPAVAALIGGGLDRVFQQAGKRWPIVAAGVSVVVIGVLAASAGYWTRAYMEHDPDGVLEGAAIVRAATAENEYVDLQCPDWNTSIMFYAERRGFVTGGDGTYTTFDDPRVCLYGTTMWGVDLWGVD